MSRERVTAACTRSLSAVVVLVLLGLCGAAPAVADDDIRSKEYWLKDYGITEAWKTSQGEGVKVAVIDSGVDGSHPDLKGVVVGGTDVSGAGAANGQQGIGKTPEHGTLVASLLAGRGHTDKGPSASPGPKASPHLLDRYGRGPDGIIGVAPKAEILAVSAFIGLENPGGVSIDQQIPNAVRWAVDHGAQVINMSLGSTSASWPKSWDEAFLYAEQNDVVVITAAGNRGVGMVQVGAPATIPGVLAVAGLDVDGKASWDSSSQGITIGVAAPAEKLVGALPGGMYANWSGTSGAAPLVAGVAALIRSEYPDMSAAQVINRIITTATDAGVPGHDPIYGYGVLDAAAAVNAPVPVVEVNPLGTISEWIRIHRRGQVPAATATASPPEQERTAEAPVPEPTVPEAIEPASENSGLPALIVLGFGAMIVFIVAAGGYQVFQARRQRGDSGEDDSADDSS